MLDGCNEKLRSAVLLMSRRMTSYRTAVVGIIIFFHFNVRMTWREGLVLIITPKLTLHKTKLQEFV